MEWDNCRTRKTAIEQACNNKWNDINFAQAYLI